MKLLTLFVALITVPLLAQDAFDTDMQEMWLGLVVGAQGDSLLLVDEVKVHVPNLNYATFIDDNDHIINTAISYPFTASLVSTSVSSGLSSEARTEARTVTTTIKIHDFYDVVDGRLVKRNSE